MAYSFGGGVRPELGATNYGGYLQGALAGAQMSAQGQAAVGQGLANLGQQLGGAIQQYYAKKEQKALDEQAFNVAQGIAKKYPALMANLGLQDPNDEKALRSITKTVGAANILQLANQFEKQQEAENVAKQTSAIANLYAQYSPEEIAQLDMGVYDPRALEAGRQSGLQEQLLRAQINKANTQKPTVGRVITQDEFTKYKDSGVDVEGTPNPDGTITLTKIGSFAPAVPLIAPNESSFAKTVGEETAKRQIGEYDAAQKAAENINKLKDTLSVINTSELNTGIGAEVFQNIDRVRAKFLGDKEAGKKVSDTEILDALLGSDVFPMIGSLGIGARGLDTPAEREFLRNVMTGTIALNKDTIRRMTEMRLKIQERAIERFNKNLDRGVYDNFFKASGYPKERVVITEQPAPVDIFAEADAIIGK